MAKMKLAIPENVIDQHKAGLVQRQLGGELLDAVKRNFPNWRRRTEIWAGEIILQNTDFTQPIKGMKPGIHLTVSLVSFRPERDYYGLAEDLVTIIKETRDDGVAFMTEVNVFVQLTLDMSVVKDGDGRHYCADPTGKILLEFGSIETSDDGKGWCFCEK